jgi:zinc transport system permease protein
MSEFVALFQNAIIAALLLAPLVAVAGSLMLLQRQSYTAAAIAHGSYGGIGLALLLGIPLLAGTAIFAVTLALLLAWLTYRKSERSDILIGAIWAVGMSLGIIFVDLSPGYGADLMGYLFGNILLVSDTDLWLLTAADIALIASVALLKEHFLAIAYDLEFARVRRIPTAILHAFTALLLALAIIASIRAVGLILVIALFGIPPYIAERLARNFTQMLILATLFAGIFLFAGLGASYLFDISATAAIILAAAAALFIKEALWK